MSKRRSIRGAIAALSAVALFGCSASSGSSLSGSPPPDAGRSDAPRVWTPITPLDVSQPHYGKTYAEWGSAWWQWLLTFDVHGSQCDDPAADTTGAFCADSQDPKSPVFFLAGTLGGKTIRTQCVVPAGKALFLPLLNTAQFGGMPSSMTSTDDVAAVNSWVSQASLSSLELQVDGVSMPGLSRLLVTPTEFSCVVEAPPNVYTCEGGPALSGPLSGYQGGYYALLPPLSKGSHTIHFHGVAASTPPFSMDVTYDPLVVE
jgi:hypothetical protein